MDSNPLSSTLNAHSAIKSDVPMLDQIDRDRVLIAGVCNEKNPHEPVQISKLYLDHIMKEVQLGSGGFGMVFEGKDEKLRKSFAIKKTRTRAPPGTEHDEDRAREIEDHYRRELRVS